MERSVFPKKTVWPPLMSMAHSLTFKHFVFVSSKSLYLTKHGSFGVQVLTDWPSGSLLNLKEVKYHLLSTEVQPEISHLLC